MSFDISMHNTRSLHAEFEHNAGSAWVDLLATDKAGQTLEITLFFDDAKAAKLYADAINTARRMAEGEPKSATVVRIRDAAKPERVTP